MAVQQVQRAILREGVLAGRMGILDQGEEGGIAGLKKHVYGATTINCLDEFDKTTEAIGLYVGRTFGSEMKILVTRQRDTKPKKPQEPDGDVTEYTKEIFRVQANHYVRQMEDYSKNKGKVFTIILGQCTKHVKNKIVGRGDFDTMEINKDVIGLLTAIKNLASGANELLYPPVQAAHAMRALFRVRQAKGEALVEYYRRFMGLVEHAERAYGMLSPSAMTDASCRLMDAEAGDRIRQDEPGKDGQEEARQEISTKLPEERNKMLAYMFLEGSHDVYRRLLNDLKNDYALGKMMYPKTVEDALHVLDTFWSKQGNREAHEEGHQVSLAQQVMKRMRCWHCNERGHSKKECPNREDGDGGEASLSQIQTELTPAFLL